MANTVAGRFFSSIKLPHLNSRVHVFLLGDGSFQPENPIMLDIGSNDKQSMDSTEAAFQINLDQAQQIVNVLTNAIERIEFDERHRIISAAICAGDWNPIKDMLAKLK